MSHSHTNIQPKNIHRLGDLCIPLIDGALSSFYRTFGATDPTVFPHNENVYDSCLYQILQIECAPEPMTLLHEKGLLVNGIEYFTSTQLGGMTKLGKTHEKDFYLSIVEV
jgi:hypothetical protein